MKINKNKTQFSSVSPAFAGSYVLLGPVFWSERQRCSRTAFSEVRIDLWLPTPKAFPTGFGPLSYPSSPAAPPPRARRRCERSVTGRGPGADRPLPQQPSPSGEAEAPPSRGCGVTTPTAVGPWRCTASTRGTRAHRAPARVCSRSGRRRGCPPWGTASGCRRGCGTRYTALA